MSTPRATKRFTGQPRKNLIYAALAIVGVGLLIWVGVSAQPGTTSASSPQGTSDSGAPSAQQGEPQAPDLSRRIDGDVTAMGSVNAPVVIVEYSDFRCPFCAHYTRTIQPEIIKEYVDTGLVRLEWRDMPIFGQESADAAMAARAAGEQGLFWEFHNAVYAAAPDRGRAELPVERLREFAQEIGIPDMDKFDRDLTSPELFARVVTDHAEGSELGVTGTPSFLINGIPMTGAQPVDKFRTLIDRELARAARN